MTSIKASKHNGMSSQSIASVKHFLEMHQYNTKDFPQLEGITLYLLKIRPEIKAYMTANLFAEKTSRNRVKEVDVLGMDLVSSVEQRPAKLTQVAVKGTEEEFKTYLKQMEERKQSLTEIRTTFQSNRKKLTEQLATNPDLIALKLPPTLIATLTKEELPNSISSFQESNSNVMSFQQLLDNLPRVFDFVRIRVMKKMDDLIKSARDFWKKAVSDYDDDEEEFYDQYADYLDEDGNLDPTETLKSLDGYDGLHFWSEALSSESNTTTRDHIKTLQKKSSNERVAELTSIFNSLKENKNSSTIYSLQIRLLHKMITSFTEFISYYGTEDDSLKEIGGFYETVVEVVEVIESEKEKLNLIERYNRENKPINRNVFQPLYEAERELERSRLIGIPYLGFLTLMQDDLPDYEGLKYVAKSLREFPNSEEIVLLNYIENAVIKQMTITDEKIVGVGVASKTVKETREEIFLVGYLIEPGYLIKIKSVGVVVEAEMYDRNPDSLPSQDKSQMDYIHHCTSYRHRRRGKIYCVFYVGREVFAVDHTHIYSLSSRSIQAYLPTLPRLLSNLKAYLISQEAERQEVSRLLNEIYLLGINSSWKSSNQVQFNRLEEILMSVNHLSMNELKQRLLKLTELITESSDVLDLYTIEALLYVFDLSKVNLTQKEDANINYNDSTHTSDTYLTASVCRPDEVFYNSFNGFPYDVMILRSNIFPRPLLSELDQATVIRKKKVNMLDANRRECLITIPYPERIWFREVRNTGYNRTHLSIPTLEIFDSTTMSKSVYCSPDEYAIELLTEMGKVLEIGEIKKRLETAMTSNLVYRQYSAPPTTSIARFLTSSITSPLIAYQLSNPLTSVPSNAAIVVSQALRQIACTLYHKMVGGFGKFQDLTMAINSTSPLTNQVFSRFTLEQMCEYVPGSSVVHKEGNLTFKCNVESIDGEKVYLKVSQDPKRILSLSTEEQKRDFYGYLETFIEQATNIQKTFSLPQQEVSEGFRKMIDSISIPELLKAQVIAHILDSGMRELSSSAVNEFIEIVSKRKQSGSNAVKRSKDSEMSSTSVSSSYGLSVVRTENSLTIEDTIMGKTRVIELPITITTKITLGKKEVKERDLNEGFKGTLDMTFLTLLDRILYPSRNHLSLLNRLHIVYHTYETGRFTPEELGSLLWSELIERRLTTEQIAKLYHLLAYQPRNLILQPTEKVALRETIIAVKPVLQLRRFIPWLLTPEK